MEFYTRMDPVPPIHQQYCLYHGVKPLRIDHFNCFSPTLTKPSPSGTGSAFASPKTLKMPTPAAFGPHAPPRKGSVDDIAFTNGTGPRLHHTVSWVPTLLNIIDLLDLMSTTGWLANIKRGPDRHGISNAFLLYISDPDGHRIEIYRSNYQTVDPEQEPIKWDLKGP